MHHVRVCLSIVGGYLSVLRRQAVTLPSLQFVISICFLFSSKECTVQSGSVPFPVHLGKGHKPPLPVYYCLCTFGHKCTFFSSLSSFLVHTLRTV